MSTYSSIGIYGDSFAQDILEISWVNQLRLMLNCNVICYGLRGTSLIYSYSKFLNNYSKHDLNIFVLTDPSREDVYDNDVGFKTIAKDSGKIRDRIIARGIETKRTLYPKSYYFYNLAILDSILVKDKNVVIINAMNHDYSHSAMINIQSLDHNYFYNTLNPELENTNRSCHMSKKQNLEFAQYLVQHLNNEIDIHETLKFENVKKYYTRSSTLDEAGLNKK
jgi:hypothetical protein